jgi:hypothetical protein
LRHSKVRPQVLQILSLCGVVRSGLRLRSGMELSVMPAAQGRFDQI